MGTIPLKRLIELQELIISTLLSETTTNDTLSPALRCINLRTSTGIVTCPLTDIVEVMAFSFANSGMIAFPYREVKRESKALFYLKKMAVPSPKYSPKRVSKSVSPLKVTLDTRSARAATGNDAVPPCAESRTHSAS